MATQFACRRPCVLLFGPKETKSTFLFFSLFVTLKMAPLPRKKSPYLPVLYGELEPLPVARREPTKRCGSRQPRVVRTFRGHARAGTVGRRRLRRRGDAHRASSRLLSPQPQNPTPRRCDVCGSQSTYGTSVDLRSYHSVVLDTSGSSLGRHGRWESQPARRWRRPH